MPKKQIVTKSKTFAPNQLEIGILIVLILVLVGVLAFSFHKYQQKHNYISNPDPALFNK